MQEPALSNNTPNAITKWHSTDSEELFDENWNDEERRGLIEPLGWTKESITYEFDELGFRNPKHYINGEHCLALGCSFTLGVGLPASVVWPSVLAEKIQCRIYNAGLSGSSADTAFRLARKMIPQYCPKAVFFLVPDANRMEIISEYLNNGATHSFSVWDYDKPEFEQLARYLGGAHHQMLHQEKNRLAIEQLCVREGIPYFDITSDPLPGGICNMIDCQARDLSHSGPHYHRRLAEMFHHMYQNRTIR